MTSLSTACVAGVAVVAVACGAVLLAQPPAAPQAPIPPLLQNYRLVTAERLKQPEDHNWLMNRRTYDGWGYSPLSQLTPANVGRLTPVWSFATGVAFGHEAPPLVNEGVMFVATPQNQVIAIDARTGLILWRYRRPAPPDVILLHPTSRGVALAGDKVLFARGEAVLVALDVKTGREVWSAEVEDNRKGYYMSLAPLVADGKVLVGASGGELGVRGFVAAFDLATGAPLWKTYTVPAPGEPGSETWPRGDQWKTGGGSVWVTANYDAEANIAYWGTGNGGPWMGDQRPGDNLYTSSTVAIDVATGAIKGHFQYTPNESWDWDEVSPPVLVDFRRGDRNVRGLINVARNGYLWFLERSKAGPISFVDATNYVKQSSVPSTRRRDVPTSTRRGSPAPASARSSVRRSGAGRTGRPSRSIRKRG
jgi:alcohol dehydrogenase (cytochrome c)